MKPTIVFFGSSENSVLVLEHLLKTNSVVLCLTLPDRVLGRKKVLTPNPVAASAEKNQIKVLKTEKILPEIIEQIKDTNPDFLIVADFGLILPENLLSLPHYASLNIHPSLLPIYRGATPVQTAILNGDKKTGVSIITVVKKVDSGNILAQEEYELSGKETTPSLLPILFEKGTLLLEEVIHSYLSHSQKETPQDEEKAVLTKMLSKNDGLFSFENPPQRKKIDQMIRAYYPWPGVWTKISVRGKKLILKFLPEGLVQPEGGKPMKIADFLNGYPELKDSFEKNIL